MLASEQFQQVVVPRLHAEADSVDSEFFENRGFASGNASRIRFDCPLDQFRQVELLMKSAQQQFQLRDVERGGRAATEINRRWKEQGAAVSSPVPVPLSEIASLMFQLAQNRFTKSPRLRAIEQILVKRAVRADTRAEGNVNVNVTDGHGIAQSVVLSAPRGTLVGRPTLSSTCQSCDSRCYS